MLRARRYTADRHAPAGLVQTFLDAELDGATARLVRTHLDRCGGCRTDAEVFRGIAASIRGLGFAPDAAALTRLRGTVVHLTSAGS